MFPILQTKLFIPQVQTDLVSRPRLIAQFQIGIKKKLILVSAPAGFGKTTIVCQWLQQLEAQATWVSLDAEDNDLARFLSYLIASIQKLFPDVGKTTLEMLSELEMSSVHNILIPLINDLVTLSEEQENVQQRDTVLVLDDYHIIQSSKIHECLAFLIENVPNTIHFLLTSRSLPALPLARLRARNQMVEIKEKNLRFSEKEVHFFFNQLMDFQLSAQKLKMLEERTEGWIAGMQMAAISMKSAQDVDHFITDFSGNDRFITDYLIEEVLNTIPTDLQTFLLQSSLLHHLHGPLCDAVTKQGNSQQLLEMLEAANLFIIELDHQRQWYRLHHLFADLLRKRFTQLFPEQVRGIHQRASLWYEQAEMNENALEHALATNDWERGTSLFEQMILDLLHGNGRFFQPKIWFDRLPDELILLRPRLAFMYAFVLYEEGISNIEQMEAIANTLENYSLNGLPVLREKSKEDFAPEQLLGFSQIIRATIARQRGDTETTISYAQEALQNLPTMDKSGAYYALGVAYFFQGLMTKSLEEMRGFLKQGVNSTNIGVVLVVNGWILEILFFQGEHIELRQTFKEVIENFEHFQLPGAGILYINYAAMLYEENELEEAESFVQDGIYLCSPYVPYSVTVLQGFILLSRIQEARGQNADSILNTLNAIPANISEQVVAYPLARLDARKTQLYLSLEGHNKELESFSIPTIDLPPFPYEADTLALIRIKIHQKKYQDALNLLDRVQESTEQGGRLRSTLTAKLLRAQLFKLTQKEEESISILHDIVIDAKSKGFFRLLLDDGASLKSQFIQLVKQGVEVSFIQSLLPHLETTQTLGVPDKSLGDVILIEALSVREMEVLRLLAIGLSNRKIADNLFITIETVKSHLKNIYGKLQVSNRTEAVSRAKALHLIP